LALVATFIPIKPAKAEQIAPKTNDNATKGEEASVFPLTPSKIATATTNIDNTLYSALRNDIAPSDIYLAMLAIFSVPTSCFDTHEDFHKVYNNAKTPNAGIANIKVCPIVYILLINEIQLLAQLKADAKLHFICIFPNIHAQIIIALVQRPLSPICS
jgi:hypothetical protein